MLVLSRKVREKIFIDVAGGIYITIVSVRDDKVRIGFEADPKVIIHREEIYNRIKDERREHCQGQEKPVSNANTAQEKLSE